MAALLNRKIDVESYLIVSTVISVFLIIRIFRAGVDVFVGYPLVLLNMLLLLALERLVIHKGHAMVIGAVALISLLAAHFSSTPLTSVIAQIAGISVMSIYYFSALLTSGLTIPRWMNLYSSVAFYLAVYGIVENLARHLLHYDPLSEPRLKSIFAEPSLFIYTTLPAIGYYINAWVSERRYGAEALIFVLAYLLADSALGFFGLLLIAVFTFIKRLTVWHFLAAVLVCGLLLTGLFFASENFAIRATDTARAVSTQNLVNTNGSTFALLSNIFVAWRAAMDHPLLGVGIGGYSSTYDFFVVDLDLKNPVGATRALDLTGLNKDDANSLFLRVTAELGPVGIIALIAFLVVCAQVQGKPYRQIRNALLPYFLVRMARFGAYFSMELYFFVGLYLLNYLDYRRSVAPPELARLPPDRDLSHA